MPNTLCSRFSWKCFVCLQCYVAWRSPCTHMAISKKNQISLAVLLAAILSLFTCLNLCCPSYYWSKWNTKIIQNVISNFPAVFTIFCGEATDCSYNQSDYGSSTQSPTATPMRAVPITYFLLMNSLLMDCSCVR